MNGNTKRPGDNGPDAESESEEDWEFTTVKPQVKYEEPSAPTESQVIDTKVVERRKPNLSLDETSVPKMRTRSEMAAALINHLEEDEEELSYVVAPHAKRVIALALDAVFAALLAVIVFYSAPVVRSLVQMWMDKYKLQFSLPEPIVLNIIMGIDAVVAVFFFICLPVAFYNHSFGKKMIGLKIRGQEKYSMSLVQAIQRETVYKPLGILLLAGFFVPFFNKKNLALHDYLAETVVIDKEEKSK